LPLRPALKGSVVLGVAHVRERKKTCERRVCSRVSGVCAHV
jgi:hypothetical protein